MIRFCSLFSGSSGNCLFLEAGSTRILIDAGLSGKAIEHALSCIDEKASDIDAIIISHDHIDHISAAGILSRRYDIPLYANRGTWKGMAGSIGRIKEKNCNVFDTTAEICIGDIAIQPFAVPHDTAEPVAFNININNTKITVATDIGHMPAELIDNFVGSDLVLLESNHDVSMLKAGRYPYPLKLRILSDVGHLSNDAASLVIAELAKRGTKSFILGHLSMENNYPALAYETVNALLIEYGIIAGRDILLDVAARSKPGRVINF